MKYKVGDKVRIKSLDWYNKNKDEYGDIDISHDFTFYADRRKYCGRVFTIDEVFDNCYTVKEDNREYFWSDEMIEGLAKEEMSLDEAGQITDFEYDGLSYTLPEGYQFKDENGNVINATKIVLEKKKKEYPKTLRKCCEILDIDSGCLLVSYDIGLWRDELFNSLQKLLICRDAYWKIAREEMGLGKPWEPDWNDDATHKFIIHTIKDEIYCGITLIKNHLLAFPSKEMRDAFKENFDTDLEICKEFL